MGGNSARCSTQVGAEYQGLSPDFPTEVRKWEADYEFVPLNATEFLDEKVSAKWATLLPPSALSEFPEDGLVYSSTSVTHQLHCVLAGNPADALIPQYIMGKIFSAVLTKSPNIPEPEDYEPHFLHCVDYMRQAAMCAGDLAIEPRGIDSQRGPINLDTAFNGSHVCKDYGKVRAYLDEQIKEGVREILPLDD
ncbi:hypothetical protein GRF29_69g859160 [Pseudopithomyces chartarum]|uniref:Uncharacterized protein n=1 Tax=Pseudopithomyces chartarum TaxID=1892770 RepID=A0AAN6LYH9_9PLEO|nr:hypothetical protein GRF29_69g859160 [Pseudopithomyces chartarum]